MYKTILFITSLVLITSACDAVEQKADSITVRAQMSKRTEIETEGNVDPIPRRMSELFYNAIANGNDEDAFTVAYPGRFPAEVFAKTRERLDLSEGEIETVYADDERACAISSSVPVIGEEGTAAIGLTLVKEDDRWLVKDLEILSDLQAITQFLGKFRKVAPDAVAVP